MILLDTNVLVALANPRDALHPRATADFTGATRGHQIALLTLNLVEAAFVLEQSYLRRNMRRILDEFHVAPYPLLDETELWREVFDWLTKYDDHMPDLTDAVLAVISGRDRRLRVWTYDREFTTIWRRPNGTRIPLATRAS